MGVPSPDLLVVNRLSERGRPSWCRHAAQGQIGGSAPGAELEVGGGIPDVGKSPAPEADSIWAFAAALRRGMARLPAASEVTRCARGQRATKARNLVTYITWRLAREGPENPTDGVLEKDHNTGELAF